MKNVIILITIIFSCLYSQKSFAQNLDSLLSSIDNRNPPDSIRFQECKDFMWKYLFTDLDTTLVLTEQLIQHGIEQNKNMELILAYRVKGIANKLKSNSDSAIYYMQKSLELARHENFLPGEGDALNGLGIFNYYKGRYALALDYWQKSIAIMKQTNDFSGIANLLMNIGNIYSDLEDPDQAIIYYKKSIDLVTSNNLEHIVLGSCYINLCHSYQHYGEAMIDSAIFYGKEAVSITEQSEDNHMLGFAYAVLGSSYAINEEYEKAIKFLELGIKTAASLGNENVLSLSWTELGKIYFKQGNLAKAMELCQRGLEIAEIDDALKDKKEACQCLVDIYTKKGNKVKAFDLLERLGRITDSLHIQNTSKKMQKMEFDSQMIQDSLARVVEQNMLDEAHKEEVHRKNQTRNILAGSGFILLILAGGLYGRVRYIRKSKATLQVEKDRSENLLLNILPSDIATELKETGKAEARDYDLVSILFTDFKEFTQTSEKLTAQELVSEINACFEAFDSICGKYKVEKIKTIGDAYMAAGGLPVPTNDSVKNTVLAALEMQEFISKRKAANDAINKPAFEMRVGIHTGPVVAGIVGVKKFQYDIWGDTVNTASRIESNGETGKVNISESIYELLKNDPDFTFENRGKIDVKGKGEMGMYFINSKR